MWQGGGAAVEGRVEGGVGTRAGGGASPTQEAVLPDTQPPPDLPVASDLPTWEELHTTLIPTLKWCPRGARGDFSRELASLWHRMADNPGEARLWCLESMFSRVILPAGRGPRAGDSCSQTKIVKERLRRWRAGEYNQLWKEAKNLTKVKTPQGQRGRVQEKEDSQLKKNSERATTLA